MWIWMWAVILDENRSHKHVFGHTASDEARPGRYNPDEVTVTPLYRSIHCFLVCPLVLLSVSAVAQTAGAFVAAPGLDLSGNWAPIVHEDQPERGPGPELGDYLGLPINAAARAKADAWDASLLTLPEWQCRPHPADYGTRGPSNMRIWKDVDRATQQVIAYHTHIACQVWAA